MAPSRRRPASTAPRPCIASRTAGVVGLVATLVATGCTSVGPGTIQRDRPAYGQSLAESWKDQMLLNVVKLRYADVPVFLDVATVITQ